MRTVRCDALSDLPQVGHAFSTRSGPGGADFDLGSHDTADPIIDRRRRALCEAAGLSGLKPRILHQVHGATVLRAKAATDASAPERADGLLALRGEADREVPAVRCADCVPLLLADREARAVGAVHAGWRGVAAGIAGEAGAALRRQGIEPSGLIALLGPAIDACCYTVGEEVVEAVCRATGVDAGVLVTPREGGAGLDLRRALGLQLEKAGLARGSVHRAPWCTCCEDGMFFSYRRSGASAGRQMACIGWSLSPDPGNRSP